MIRVQVIATEHISRVCLTIGLCVLGSTVAVQSIRADDWEQDSSQKFEAMAFKASELDDYGEADDQTESGEYGASGGDRDDCVGSDCTLSDRCGWAPRNPLDRRRKISNLRFVVNGKNQTYGEWPSFATIASQFADGSSTSCAGVLVSFEHILTAANCIYRAKGSWKSSTVKLGDHDTNRVDSQEQSFGVLRACAPKQYLTGPRSFEFDWAVLTLDRIVEPNDYRQPACLPHGHSDSKRYKHCHLIGAGAVDPKTNASTRIIQKLPVRQVSCAKYGADFVTESTVCYTKAEGQGSGCGGDSGGPVLCLDPDKWRWTVVATLTSGKCNKRNWIAAFARITFLLPKIKELCLR